MKWLWILLAFASLHAGAQITGKLENQKDAWGNTYTYIGELKGGKANGMGIAKYYSGTVVRYVGSFVNGSFDGRGTMLFKGDAFLSGNWKNGKLNGRGVNLTSDG